MRTEIPPPSESVFRAEVAQLKRTARIFLREEEVYCRDTGNRPQFLEVSIGMKNEGRSTRLDAVEPVEVRFPDGSSLRVRGRIDRIDRACRSEAERLCHLGLQDRRELEIHPGPTLLVRTGRPASLYFLAMNARLKAMAKEFPGRDDRAIRLFLPEREGQRRTDRVHSGTARTGQRRVEPARPDCIQRLVSRDNPAR